MTKNLAETTIWIQMGTTRCQRGLQGCMSGAQDHIPIVCPYSQQFASGSGIICTPIIIVLCTCKNFKCVATQYLGIQPSIVKAGEVKPWASSHKPYITWQFESNMILKVEQSAVCERKCLKLWTCNFMVEPLSVYINQINKATTWTKTWLAFISPGETSNLSDYLGNDAAKAAGLLLMASNHQIPGSFDSSATGFSLNRTRSCQSIQNWLMGCKKVFVTICMLVWGEWCHKKSCILGEKLFGLKIEAVLCSTALSCVDSILGLKWVKVCSYLQAARRVANAVENHSVLYHLQQFMLSMSGNLTHGDLSGSEILPHVGGFCYEKTICNQIPLAQVYHIWHFSHIGNDETFIL